jgi:hypothetical protein
VPYASNRDTFIMIANPSPSSGTADLVVTGARAELPRGLHLIWRTAEREGEAGP